MRTRFLGLVAVVAFVVALPTPAYAAHHLWRIQQLFSNASGSVQYVVLETNSTGRTGETQVSGFTLAVTGGVTFTLNANLPANPTTQWLLLATSNFASLPGGVTPDFVIPANFLPTGGGTITYASTVDTWTFGALPTDGIHALTRDPDTQALATAVNHPVNFANVSGQVNLAASVPTLPTWGIIAGLGALLLAGSGLWQKRRALTA
jgi:hypothetical protein